MKKEINILQSGNVYFFYRPKVENDEKEVQRFFFVLHPQNQSKYQLLVVGKKQLPSEEKDRYFLFLEAIKKNKEDLLRSLNENRYGTTTRGERVLPVSRCLGAGKFLIVEHNNHVHFIYQLTSPQKIKGMQQEFNLKKEDDYLINVKNPQTEAPLGVGLTEKQKAHYPSFLQKKFTNYRFISLNTVEFLNYEGTELLLIAKEKENLVEREKELGACLEKIPSDNLLSEFAKITSPVALAPIEE
jgi:hypothetical protein